MFKRAWLPAFLSLCLVGSSGADIKKSEDTLSGTLGYVFTDNPKGGGLTWNIQVGEKRIRLEMPHTIIASAGGITGLAGRKVHLSGRSFPEVFKVEKIGWLPQPKKELLPELPHTNSAGGNISRPQIFILVKFKDSAGVEPHTKAWYETFAYGGPGSISDYYLEQSYGLWDLSGSKVTNWVVLPKNRAEYLNGTSTGVDSEAVVRDALVAADSQVDYRQFDGFHVITNVPAGNIGGDGGRGTYTLDGETRLWGRTYDAYSDYHVLLHEIGHSFGFDHSSGGYDTHYDSQWDDMSGGGTWARYDPNYGPIPPHTNEYHRMVVGITPRTAIKECLPGTNTTVHLSRTCQPEANQFQVARIFLGGDGAHYLTVEARKRVGRYEYGASLPNEGILLHDCDPAHVDLDPWTGTYSPGPVSHVVDVDNNKDPNDEAAIWKVGETYTDAANGVTVSVVKETAAGYDVKIMVAPNAPLPLVVTNGKDSGPGSLRSAISFANLFPGSKITFAAPASALTNGELLIQPITPLPELTAANTSIDGTTQTALADSNPGMPEIAIDGSKLSGWGHGLSLMADRSVVRGLSFRNMPWAGLLLSGATKALVSGCAVGTDRTGTVAAPNRWIGMVVENGSDGITLTDLLVSGNVWGLYAHDSNDISILGGKFGTDRTGMAALGNDYNGILLERVKGASIAPNGASFPVVSGSKMQDGIGLTACTNVKFASLRVGVNATGDAAIPNASNGAWIADSTTLTIKNCQFSGNKNNGIVFAADNSVAATITGSLLGTDATGTKAVGNQGHGIWVDAPGVKIASSTLSGNKNYGAVLYHRATNASIKSSKLGTDKTGSLALPNGGKGIGVDAAQNWTVSESILSGNKEEGIATYNSAGPGTIESCRVGLGAKAEKLGSPWAGIWIGDNSHDIKVTSTQSANNVVGGIVVGPSTKITVSGGKVTDCGNTGIQVYGGANFVTISGTEIRGCKNQAIAIGDATTHDVTVTGVLADSNEWGGIALYSGAYNCKIDGNTVLNYTGCGISLQNGCHHNTVTKNMVGAKPSNPTTPMNAGWAGVGLWNGSYSNTIGAIGAGNTIGGGNQIGVYVADNTTLSNAIRGNAFLSTAKLAIDLAGDGKDLNDTTDADAGPNRKQNYPTLTKDTTVGKVKIAFQGAASRTILVDLYSVDPKRDGGSGPGYTYLGTVQLKTNASGVANNTFAVPTGTLRITAIATDKDNNDTSEFCPNLIL